MNGFGGLSEYLDYIVFTLSLDLQWKSVTSELFFILVCFAQVLEYDANKEDLRICYTLMDRDVNGESINCTNISWLPDGKKLLSTCKYFAHIRRAILYCHINWCSIDLVCYFRPRFLSADSRCKIEANTLYWSQKFLNHITRHPHVYYRDIFRSALQLYLKCVMKNYPYICILYHIGYFFQF